MIKKENQLFLAQTTTVGKYVYAYWQKRGRQSETVQCYEYNKVREGANEMFLCFNLYFLPVT